MSNAEPLFRWLSRVQAEQPVCCSELLKMLEVSANTSQALACTASAHEYSTGPFTQYRPSSQINDQYCHASIRVYVVTASQLKAKN